VNLPFTIGPQACHILRNEMRSKNADPPIDESSDLLEPRALDSSGQAKRHQSNRDSVKS